VVCGLVGAAKTGAAARLATATAAAARIRERTVMKIPIVVTTVEFGS
jgi:hypothetical protein